MRQLLGIKYRSTITKTTVFILRWETWHNKMGTDTQNLEMFNHSNIFDKNKCVSTGKD